MTIQFWSSKYIPVAQPFTREQHDFKSLISALVAIGACALSATYNRR
ncbi:hypothetical protein K788_0007415 (plasmid) [Paraburkholderia caribensis MBA4]|uniref:Uncharacterized protein n=1 Tax=Paraburkholderia caribensis MBA4 TaxID=1323664 RepID=A0A0P0RLZ6_9BURK|nr:hypothetical protein K788_0007415 [Paraburkholderia caribensis MBA4]